MTQNASQNDLKCNTKPVAVVFAFWLGHCAKANWRLRSVRCFCDRQAALYGAEFRVPTVWRKDSMSREREQAGKMLFVVRERVSTVVRTRHLAESRVYRVRSRSSPIFEKSVCDMAGRCTWPLFCGWTRSVRRETAKRTGKLIRSNWFLHPLRDLWDFSLVEESWLKIPIGESYDARGAE